MILENISLWFSKNINTVEKLGLYILYSSVVDPEPALLFDKDPNPGVARSTILAFFDENDSDWPKG